MKLMKKSLWLGTAGLVLIVGITLMTGAAKSAEPVIKVLRISSKKFEFVPHHITLKKNLPVIFVFVAEDIPMGFNAPDLKIRSDMLPGKSLQLRVTPKKAGKFNFFCDVFCGAGHEEMTGDITVVE